MRKEYILTEEEKQRKRQKIEENRIRKSSVTSEDVITQAVLVSFNSLHILFRLHTVTYVAVTASDVKT